MLARTPKQVERRKRGRTRGKYLNHRWNLAAKWTIRQKMMTAKTTAPCLPPPPAPDPLASVSQQMGKSCGAWLKTHHQPKSCESFQGGWSRWWRRRSRERGDGERAALAVELLLRRQLWRRTLQDLSMNQTKTTHHRALTANPRGPLQNLLRTKTLLPVPLCTLSLSEVILHIPHPIFLLTCPC